MRADSRAWSATRSVAPSSGGGETTDTVVKVTEVDGLMMNFQINPA